MTRPLEVERPLSPPEEEESDSSSLFGDISKVKVCVWKAGGMKGEEVQEVGIVGREEAGEKKEG